MRCWTNLLFLGLVTALTSAKTPTLCSKYTTALFGQDTPANEYTLLLKLVNTVVIGNYTQPNVGIAVPGILAPNASYNGHTINLLQYFDGSLLSTNNGTAPVAVNFLDDGGAAALMENKPSFHDDSNQYFLLTHLYQFFGTLLGCKTGTKAFPKYGGDASMFSVHRYMSLSHAQIGYFNSQVQTAFLSFGGTADDAQYVFEALQSLFNYKCLPKSTVVPAQGKQLQSICDSPSCPIDMSPPYSNCKAYPNGGVEPGPAPA